MSKNEVEGVDKKIIKKIAKKIKENPFCNIKLKVHQGNVKVIETKIKEKL